IGTTTADAAPVVSPPDEVAVPPDAPVGSAEDTAAVALAEEASADKKVGEAPAELAGESVNEDGDGTVAAAAVAATAAAAAAAVSTETPSSDERTI
ncbi:unnamed protein product, partial [Ectocarpus sp. 12 AP-2014]